MDTTRKIDWWVLGAVALLLIGVVVGVILVSQPQIFRSRASVRIPPPESKEAWRFLQYQNENGDWVRCEQGPVNPVCKASSINFTIRYRP
jgi:hypothetical protein